MAGAAAGVRPAFSLWSTGASASNIGLGDMSYRQAGAAAWMGGTAVFAGLANNNAGGCRNPAGADPASCGNSYGQGPGPGAAAFVGAGSWYLLVVGGSGGGSGGYTVTVAPAPLPAGVWLLASALGGLGAFGRRRPGARRLSVGGVWHMP